MRRAKDHYHLAGVAGVGMSGLAQVLIAEGRAVSGSDRHLDGGADLDILRKLRAAGVRLVPQDGRGVSGRTKALVVSTAIEEANPDIRAARRLKVPVVHRAQMLAELVEGKPSIAVAGTSGKSTVTGMIGWILDRAGMDPVVVNGGAVLNWLSKERIGNARIADRTGGHRAARKDGASWWVFEADESDRSLLNFHPDWAVITNVSADHFSAAESKALFRRFRAQVRKGVVSLSDDPKLARLLRPRLSIFGSRFQYKGVVFHLGIPGRHNVENAMHAVLTCERIGVDLKRVAAALSSFRGIERRLELVGKAGGISVIDDYAHNPAKIGASCRSLTPYYREVTVIWRPHGYGPLRAMMRDLVKVLAASCRKTDRIYILSVYDAGGTADRSVTSDELVAELKTRGLHAALVEDSADLTERIAGEARAGDAIVTMGARDPGLPLLARRILDELRVKAG